jgi:malonyl-CoA decarboxylase
MSACVQPLIDPDAPIRPVDTADSAIFYSITKCQDGLGGVPLGGFLINKALEELSAELPPRGTPKTGHGWTPENRPTR